MKSAEQYCDIVWEGLLIENSEQQQREEGLDHSAERFSAPLAAAPVGLSETDSWGTCTYINLLLVSKNNARSKCSTH